MKDQENHPELALDWLPEALKPVKPNMLQETAALHAGDTCPRCQIGLLDYDGLLNLACSQCGYSLNGCFT
jgi:uncharacterized protein (DUF983 family)